ncbi:MULTISPECIES: carboxymuconolactone decarboxylase family protein [Providencia]|uniref:carboxymuconolactone decarboxylase family protein n=1 Tax=Providencia TaxID=586 RepID=UPI0003E2AC76|nr:MULTISPECIES: carboxymuconolactone decarboxylase family protein [Providencia]ETT02913.1 carboxymuconolactone decarboxylase family protein [Providencia alcalifaciens PAL-3]EUC98815.1 carboxymuconolactone decarboxylase family protein [Providencia alcalifaciens PAL-1]MBG5884802.1 carboxymuconolactone decarboxylase family protein [Providencia alcalifaciens]MTB45130.1 carboxymuconolactone decarboxylase family protein [Providencia sp. wls1950]MTC23595.1 carboxymuconolactone decarboxylase family p
MKPEIIGRSDWNQFEKIAPEVVAAMGELGKAVSNSGLEKPLTELLKIRVSQINGCAFCLQYHLNLARKLGIEAAKLDLLPTWRDAGIYTPREQAALSWAESLTLMAAQHVSDDVYQALQNEFTESEIAFLTSAIGAINAWNRIAGALQFAPPIPKSSL